MTIHSFNHFMKVHHKNPQFENVHQLINDFGFECAEFEESWHSVNIHLIKTIDCRPYTFELYFSKNPSKNTIEKISLIISNPKRYFDLINDYKTTRTEIAKILYS